MGISCPQDAKDWRVHVVFHAVSAQPLLRQLKPATHATTGTQLLTHAAECREFLGGVENLAQERRRGARLWGAENPQLVQTTWETMHCAVACHYHFNNHTVFKIVQET